MTVKFEDLREGSIVIVRGCFGTGPEERVKVEGAWTGTLRMAILALTTTAAGLTWIRYNESCSTDPAAREVDTDLFWQYNKHIQTQEPQ
jgi:hypothetical protein